MPAVAGTAFVDVRGDFTNFNKDIDRSTRGTRSKFSAVGKAAALGMAAGLGGAAIAIKGFADAAIDAQKSQARMQAQLKASGISFKAHAKEIDNVIQRVSKLSGLDDEDLQDSFTNIVRVTGDVNKSLRLTGLAADFARAKHLDVAKAGEIVAKVAGGNTGVLARYGVQLDKNATSSEALAALQKKFAGQAEAYGKTAGGAQDRFRVAVENLQEALGQKLLPVIATVANAAATFIDGLSKGEGVGGRIRDIFEQVKTKVSDLGESFKGVAEIASTLWRAFGDNVLGVMKTVAEGIRDQVASVLKIFHGLIDFVSGVLSGDWGKAWDGIKETFDGVWRSIVAGLHIALGLAKEALDAGLTILKAIWGAAWDAMVGAIKALGGQLAAAARWVVDKVIDSIKLQVTGLVAVGSWVLNRIVDGVKTVTDLLSGVGGWVKNRVVEFIQAEIAGYKTVGSWIVNRLADGIRTVTDLLGSVGGWIKNRVVEFIQAEVAGLIAVGSWIVNRVVDGFKTVTDALGGVGGWLKNRISELVHDAGDGFASLGGWIVDKIVDGLKGGANLLVGFVNKIIGIINKIPGVEIGAIKGFRVGGTTDEIPAFAQGGVTHHDQLAAGGTITRPMMVVGEEAPRHPEFIIPTNPSYRGRAVGLFGQLGSQLGIPGFALGGILGGLPSADGLGWLKGTGEFLLGKVTGFIKDKIGSLFGGIFSSSFDAGDIQKVLARLVPMGKLMDSIDDKHWDYVYGGGHGSFNGPYDCSGLVSAILHAGGFLGSPVTTDQLKTFGDAGDGKYITVGVRGSTGRNAHTMMRIGNKYLESGGGHGAAWVNGWDGNFPIHRHPAGFARGGILNEDLLKKLIGDGGLGWGLAKGGIVGPYVGAYKLGGVVPRDGMAYVHAGETITPAGQAQEIRVFIGDRELTDIVRVEIDERDRAGGAFYRAGSLT